MDLLVIFLGIFGIVLVVFVYWFRLRDVDEDELISLGFGTYVNRNAFKARMVLGLLICLIILFMGLVW